MKAMLAMARFLTALFLAGLLLVPSPVQSAPADLAVLNEALDLLRTRHWNPSLDMPSIVRAGVPGLNRTLARAGVTQRLEPIPEGAEPATIAAFGQRLDEAVRVAGGRLAERDLLYGALRSMFEHVGGSHTAFLMPSTRQIREALTGGRAYVGIGIALRRDGDRWIVTEVFPEGPAARAGLRRGDAVLRIDDVVVGDTVVNELIGGDVLAMVSGTPGTLVRLTLRRGTEELQVSVTRGTVTSPVTEGRMLGDGIAYLHVYYFPVGSQEQIRSRFATLWQAQPRGLVLDLRSNNGGQADGLLALLGIFLPQNTRIVQTINRAGQVIFMATTDVPIAPALPLIVLINRYTISAGEIAAAAFKETGRASLVGERTQGAVEGAPIFGLSDGSGAWIATRRALTVQGRELEGKGVSPDVEFPHDLAADRDLLLERGVQLLERLR